MFDPRCSSYIFQPEIGETLFIFGIVSCATIKCTKYVWGPPVDAAGRSCLDLGHQFEQCSFRPWLHHKASWLTQQRADLISGPFRYDMPRYFSVSLILSSRLSWLSSKWEDDRKRLAGSGLVRPSTTFSKWCITGIFPHTQVHAAGR